MIQNNDKDNGNNLDNKVKDKEVKHNKVKIIADGICCAINNNGTRCTRRSVFKNSGYCMMHYLSREYYITKKAKKSKNAKLKKKKEKLLAKTIKINEFNNKLNLSFRTINASKFT